MQADRTQLLLEAFSANPSPLPQRGERKKFVQPIHMLTRGLCFISVIKNSSLRDQRGERENFNGFTNIICA